MSKQKTKEEYHNLAESCGFKWIGSVLPKNIITVTLWKCGNEHIFNSRYNDIQRGQGCPYCSGRAKKTKNDYYKLAKKYNFEWVDKNLPRNVNTNTFWKCSINHIFKASYSNLVKSPGCPYCSGHIPKTEKDYNSLAKKYNFKWIGKNLPKTTQYPTLWKCHKGHKWKARYGDIRSEKGCPYCYGKNIKKTEKDYNNLASNLGFIWIDTKLPKNVSTETIWRCDKDHEFRRTYNYLQHPAGCPYCDDRVNGVPASKPQIKLNDLLCGNLNYPEGRYRIDVAIMRKSQKIAVEYDCQYWHDGREKQDAKRDGFLISCGWKMIHIKSNKLLPNRKQMKQAIKQLDNKNLINIFLDDWKF